MVSRANEGVRRAASCLRTKLVEHIRNRIGHSLTDTGSIRASGKEQTNRLRVGGVDDKRTRVAGVTKAITADGDLAGE